MNIVLKEKNYTAAFLTASVLVVISCLVSHFASSITFDSGDGIRHYFISRYSWQHPALLLDHWGKPFFILIASPFAQFGMHGMNVFNILCMVGSFLSGYAIANKMNLRFAWIYPVLLGFAPIYFGTINSGLTEPLFGFVLIFSIFLFYDKKYLLSVLLISFLPFVRSEGNMVLPLFALLLLYRKRFYLIPLLAAGTLIYSIIGYFHFHDFFWVINQNPYKGQNAAMYGHGPLLYFVKACKDIFSIPLSLLIVAGLLLIGLRIFKRTKVENEFFTEEIILVAGSFLVYFVAHSVFWWKGLFNSFGLIRVMAAVMPCAALVALRGLNELPAISKYLRPVQIAILVVFPVWMVLYLYHAGLFSIKEQSDAEIIDESTSWFKDTEYKNNLIAYLYPYLDYKLERDPFDYSKVREIWGLERPDPAKFLPDGTIIFWDSHFSPNEGALPLKNLLDNPCFVLLKRFKSLSKEVYLGGEFEINVFKKINCDSSNVIQNRNVFSGLDSLANTRDYKIKAYEYRMRHSESWMKEIKRKAKDRNIPVDTMIKMDAVWMLNNEKK